MSRSFFQFPCRNLPKPKLTLTPACTNTHLHTEDFSISLVTKYLFCNLVSGSSQATMQLCSLNPDSVSLANCAPVPCIVCLTTTCFTSLFCKHQGKPRQGPMSCDTLCWPEPPKTHFMTWGLFGCLSVLFWYHPGNRSLAHWSRVLSSWV